MYDQGIPCLWMRGGSSKGAYFLSADLPKDRALLDPLLLSIMGSPDNRQIDGIGGADPLTSKVAILSPSSRTDADIDYMFLQVFVDQALVSDAQGCGNILAGVGPAAIERGLMQATGNLTEVRIHMLNTGEVATAKVKTGNGKVIYRGDAEIAGVPGHHAPVPLLFTNIAGAMCGGLLPSGRVIDRIDGVDVTLIDNGMPCVVMRAEDLSLTGHENVSELESNQELKSKIEAIRLKAGPLMNLGDVTHASVPKMFFVSKSECAHINTRCFIPHKVHSSIGVLAAITIATAMRLEGSTAYGLSEVVNDGLYQLEHPTGQTEVFLDVGADGQVVAAGSIRTARKLMDGLVFPNL